MSGEIRVSRGSTLRFLIEITDDNDQPLASIDAARLVAGDLDLTLDAGLSQPVAGTIQVEAATADLPVGVSSLEVKVRHGGVISTALQANLRVTSSVIGDEVAPA